MGKTTDEPMTTHGKVTAFPPFSHEEMLREGTRPWESQLLFLAWGWNGCNPHPQVSGTSQTHGNNNIPLLLIQVAAGCRRKLLPFCLWEESTHKHVAVVLIILFVLQTLQGLLRVSVKTPQLCFQACVLAKPSITRLLTAFTVATHEPHWQAC